MPLEWIGYQDAVRLYHLEQVAYTCGTLLYRESYALAKGNPIEE